MTALAQQRKELPIIARAVAKAYDAGPRPHVEWESPETGEIVTAPEWTHESITRHLLYSTEFRCLFHSAVDQVFHALIVTQNATVITPDGVDEDRRKALMHTIDTYGKWVKIKAAAGPDSA